MATHLANNGQLRESVEFTVEGFGEFPYDMLRYDACWPATEATDSYNMSSRYHGISMRRRVTLRTHNPYAPTEGRWSSFGWHIVKV